jgi:hypothetical protein
VYSFQGEMMNARNIDFADLSRERAKRRAQKHNAAFRRQLEQRKAARHASVKLKLASLAAATSWVVVGIQMIR